MPLREGPFYVEEPPEFEYRNGLFHIVQRLDGTRVERVMRPSVFMAALRKAAETARQHKFAGARIVEFARESEKDASTA